MAHTFSYEFSTPEPPQVARRRLESAITERLRRPVGASGTGNLHREMRLSKQTETSLSYKPKLVAPLPISTIIWLGRVLGAQNVSVTFTPDASGGATHVAVSGKVGSGSDMIADREFWTELLSADRSARG